MVPDYGRCPPGRQAAVLPQRVAPLYGQAPDLHSITEIMALFFDQKWFNARLKDAGLTKGELAKSLGLTNVELEEMWKDQREILDREIGTMALLLGVSESEVKKRGGLQGSPEARAALRSKSEGAAPASGSQDLAARVAELEERLAKLEARLAKSP